MREKVWMPYTPGSREEGTAKQPLSDMAKRGQRRTQQKMRASLTSNCHPFGTPQHTRMTPPNSCPSIDRTRRCGASRCFPTEDPPPCLCRVPQALLCCMTHRLAVGRWPCVRQLLVAVGSCRLDDSQLSFTPQMVTGCRLTKFALCDSVLDLSALVGVCDAVPVVTG